MKFFIDTADIKEIKEANARGWVDGVTTNPTLVMKTGMSNADCIAQICKEVKGPVSAEVMSLTADKMYEEGKTLAKIADNVVVKIPMCEEGLVAVRRFTADGIKTNVTLVFSPLQALMVAKAGAAMVSPFVGRLDDISIVGMDLIENIRTIFTNYDYKTEILVASIRHPIHVLDAALIGADIVTCPLKVIKQLVNHPLTDAGIQQFVRDSEKVPK